MIVRDVNVNDLSKFDFTNDAKDTILWLKSQQRFKEGGTLMAQWISSNVVKRLKTEARSIGLNGGQY